MKKLIAPAVLAFVVAAGHQAVACDFGAHAANATPVVVACNGSDCKPTEGRSTEQRAATEAPAPSLAATQERLTTPAAR